MDPTAAYSLPEQAAVFCLQARQLALQPGEVRTHRM